METVTFKDSDFWEELLLRTVSLKHSYFWERLIVRNKYF